MTKAREMVVFNDLPLELLTNILGHLVRPHHLTLACRVDKTFYTFGIQFLYVRVHIASWHKNPKYRVSHSLDSHRGLGGLEGG